MAIEATHAFKISDGRCFSSKQEAYTADTTHLYRSLPKAEGKTPVAKEFRKLIQQVKLWVTQAEALEAQMAGEVDVEVSRSIVGQG